MDSLLRLSPRSDCFILDLTTVASSLLEMSISTPVGGRAAVFNKRWWRSKVSLSIVSVQGGQPLALICKDGLFEL
jgi:hypothetical protein